MTDSKMVLKAAVDLVDQLQLENDNLKQRNDVLERLVLSAITDAEIFRYMKTLSTSQLSMLCFEHTQGSGTLEELVKISMGTQ